MSKNHKDFERFFHEDDRNPPHAHPLHWNLWTVKDEIGVFDNETSFESTNARALFWNLVDNPSVVSLPSITEDNREMGKGVWLGVLDLLAYGCGWTNIRRELNWWAMGGFEVIDEPVFGRLNRDLGPALLALVWYLNKYEKAATRIESYLTSIGLPSFTDEESGIYDGRGPDFLELSEIESYLEHQDIKQRYPVTAVLLDGEGDDPAGLVRAFTFESLSEDDEDRTSVVEIDEHHLQIAFQNYSHWYRNLHRLVDEFMVEAWGSEGLLSPRGFRVDVWVRGIGFLGQFVFDEERNRFVRDIKVLDFGVAHRFGPRRKDFLSMPSFREDSTRLRAEPEAHSSEQDGLMWFDAVPEALQNLLRDLIQRTEEKLGKDEARDYVKVLVAFSSGHISLTQEEATAEMSTLLRVLT